MMSEQEPLNNVDEVTEADAARRFTVLNGLDTVITLAQQQGTGTYSLEIVVDSGGDVGFALRKTS